jgi:DNA invertase Pin-like site-specific DNA recombinase
MITIDKIRGRTAIALARQSDKDRQKDSIPSQRDTISTFAKDNDIILEDVVGTNGGIYEHKGSALDERVDLQRIIQDFENGLFDSEFIILRDESR